MKRRHLLTVLIALGAAAAGGSVVWFLRTPPEAPSQAPAAEHTLYQCPMHHEYKSPKPGTCGICGMKLVPVSQRHSDSGIVQIDPHIVQTIGVRIETLQLRSVEKIIRALGYVQADESRIATVTVKVRGWVERLLVRTTGEYLRKGSPMVTLYSPELLSAQEEFVQALSYAERLQRSGADNTALRAAQAGVAAARRRLELWDVPLELIRELERTRQPQRTVTLSAPFDGVVLERLIADGAELQPGQPLFRLADLSHVWVVAELSAPDLPWIRPGLPAELEFPALAGTRLQSTLFFVEPLANPASSTVRGRFRLPNLSGRLRPGMYAIVQVRVRSPRPVLVIPEDAVLRTGKRDVAIRALGQGRFQPVEVQLGAAWDGYYELLHGLRPGDSIVVSAQFLIDSESKLRAGLAQLGHQHGTPAPTPAPPPPEQHTPPAPHYHSEHREHSTSANGTVAIDPVCGMEVDTRTAFRYHWRGRTYYFCDSTEMVQFARNPERFLQSHEGHQR